MTGTNITVDHDEYRRVAAQLRAHASEAEAFAREFDKLPETMRAEIAGHLTNGNPGKLYDPARSAVGEISTHIGTQIPILVSNLRNIAKTLDSYVDRVEDQQDSDRSKFTTA